MSDRLLEVKNNLESITEMWISEILKKSINLLSEEIAARSEQDKQFSVGDVVFTIRNGVGGPVIDQCIVGNVHHNLSVTTILPGNGVALTYGIDSRKAYRSKEDCIASVRHEGIRP